jgi:hypothetical protein
MHHRTVNASSIRSQLHSRSISGETRTLMERNLSRWRLRVGMTVFGCEMAAKCCVSERNQSLRNHTYSTFVAENRILHRIQTKIQESVMSKAYNFSLQLHQASYRLACIPQIETAILCALLMWWLGRVSSHERFTDIYQFLLSKGTPSPLFEYEKPANLFQLDRNVV